jgi:hypothetical protein
MQPGPLHNLGMRPVAERGADYLWHYAGERKFVTISCDGVTAAAAASVGPSLHLPHETYVSAVFRAAH